MKNDWKLRMAANWRKKTANTEMIHQECAPCDELRHWLRACAKLEDPVHDTLFLVGEIARSEFVEILKSSRRFEYRLCRLIPRVAILPFKWVNQERWLLNQNYGVVADRSQSDFFLLYRSIKSFANSSKSTSRPRRNAFKLLFIFWRTSSLSTVAFFSSLELSFIVARIPDSK